MMALRYGRRHPQLRRRRTVELLSALVATGYLAAGDGELLQSDYEFLARLESQLRMETDQAAWALSTDPEKLTPLARRMGLTGAAPRAKDLLAELARRRRRVREIFTRYFTAEQARESGSVHRAQLD